MKQLVKPLLLQSWVSQILNSSLYQSWSKNDLSFRTAQIEMVNIFSIAIVCINFFLTFLDFWGVYQLYGIVSLFALTVLLLNKWQYFTASRWLFICGIYSLIFFLTASKADGFVTSLVFFLCLIALFALFTKEEKWELLGSCFLLVAIYILLQTLGFPLSAPTQEVHHGINQVFILNIGCILLSVSLAVYYVFSIYEKSEDNLKKYVKELQAKEIEIKLQNEELLKLNASLLASKEDLVKSHIFLNTIIDNLPVTLFVKDARNLKYIRLNKTGEALTRYTEKEIINKTNAELFPAEQALLFTQSDRKVLTEHKVVEAEEYFTNKYNQSHVVYTKKVPIYSNNGDPLYILGIIEDITPRKQAEETLKRTVTELETRNHELDNYAYRVSHDLRAPLCSMLGLINLAKIENDVETIKHYIHLIEKSVSKSDQFIQSILNHSKILNTAPEIELIDFEKMICNCLEELNYAQENDNIQLTANINHNNAFLNDRFRIHTILKNVISNSLKYFNPDIAHRYIKINVHIDEKSADITIEDNGIGIEATYVPKVFDMFFRGTERSNGSGLGLYIVKKATESLDAALNVTSEAGKGTRVSIVLANRLA